MANKSIDDIVKQRIAQAEEREIALSAALVLNIMGEKKESTQFDSGCDIFRGYNYALKTENMYLRMYTDEKNELKKILIELPSDTSRSLDGEKKKCVFEKDYEYKNNLKEGRFQIRTYIPGSWEKDLATLHYEASSIQRERKKAEILLKEQKRVVDLKERYGIA